MGVTTHRSNVATTPEMLAGLFGLSSHDQGVGWVSFPGPPKGKDLSGFWKERVQGSWAGVSGLTLLGGMVPQEVRAPFQPPALDGFNSRAFLRKCLSWQQLQPTPADSGSPARPEREEKGAERETERGWDLARSQTITPLLRWLDCELRLLPGLF